MLSATSLFNYFTHVPLAHASKDLNTDLQHVYVSFLLIHVIIFFVISTNINFLSFRSRSQYWSTAHLCVSFLL